MWESGHLTRSLESQRSTGSATRILLSHDHMNRSSLRRAAACAASGAFAIVFGCTSTPLTFQAQGNCDASGDALCQVTVPVTGSPSGLPDGSQIANDAGTIEDAEAGACGLDLLLSSTGMRAFPACDACVLASPCCLGEITCSNDADCGAIVACVTGQSCTDSTCVGNCETFGPNGVNDYTQLAQCITSNCSGECPFLSPVGDL